VLFEHVLVSTEHRSAKESQSASRSVEETREKGRNAPKVFRHRLRVDAPNPAAAKRDVTPNEVKRRTENNSSVQRAVLAVFADDCRTE